MKIGAFLLPDVASESFSISAIATDILLSKPPITFER